MHLYHLLEMLFPSNKKKIDFKVKKHPEISTSLLAWDKKKLLHEIRYSNMEWREKILS